jgi:hypothetical protein
MHPAVIITVPHSLCDRSNPIRNCDTLAYVAAESLYEQMPYPTWIFQSNHHRSQIDLNRDVSLETDFRRSISSKMRELKRAGYDPIFVLDVHSVKDGAWDHNHLDLLDEFSTNTPYVNRLAHLLRQSGFDIGHYAGKDNSIVQEARRNGFISVLFEFNESLPEWRVDEITPVIVEWVRREIYRYQQLILGPRRLTR